MSDEPKVARGTGKDVAALLARTVLTRGLGFLRSIVILPLIGPGELGTLRYLLTITSYSVYLHCGALTTFGMRYPEWVAAGKTERALSVRALAFQVVVVGAVVAFAAVLGALVWTRTVALWLALVVAGFAGLQLLSTYVGVSFRAHGEFQGMAKNDTIVTVVAFFGGVVGAYLLGVGGLMLASLASVVAGIFAARRWLFPKSWTRFDRDLMRAELPYGAVLMSTSIFNQVSMSIDLVIIKPYFANGDARYGYYAFGAMLAALVYGLMDSLAQVQANRMYEAAGKRERGIDGVLDELEGCAVREALASVLAVSIGAIGIGLVTPILLRRYVGGLPILGLFLWAGVLLRMRTYPAILLNIVRANRWGNIASGLAIAATFVHCIVVHHWFHDSLVGFAACSAVAYTFTIVIGAIGAYAAVGRASRLARFGPYLLATTAPTALFAPLFLVPADRLPIAYAALGVVVPLLSAAIVARLFPTYFRQLVEVAGRLLRRRARTAPSA